MSDFKDLHDAVAPLGRRGQLGVAVSGGSDSLALLHLLREAGGVTLRVATVNHGLRPEAASEADRVAAICAGLGIDHDRLDWTGWDLVGNLQDRARQARYRLLADWAGRHRLAAVALGHSLDDQAETFLMRLARQAGVDGLSRMAAEFTRDGAVFLRPLLGCRRAELRRYLGAKGQDWIDDPSNEDARFDRVKARKALAHLAPLGIGAEGLARVADHMASAREALQVQAADAAPQIARLEAGALVFARAGLLELPSETCRRLLTGALQFVAAGPYAPRSGPVLALRDDISQGRNAALHGCRLIVRGDEAWIARELNAVAETASPTDLLWDGRWRISGPDATDLHVAPLGETGLAACPDWRATGLPRDVLTVTPGIWREGSLISAPIAGLSAGWCAELAQSREEYVNSLVSH